MSHILNLDTALWLTHPEVRRMNPAQRGAYLDLMCLMKLEDDAGVLADEVELINKLEITHLDFCVIKKRLTLKDGKFYQRRLKKEHKNSTKEAKPKKEKLTPEQIKLKDECFSLYIEFYKQRMNGMKPDINIIQGKALYELMKYFKSAKEGNTDEMVFESFKLIYQHWDKLSERLQQGITPVNIKYNLPQILIEIKKLVYSGQAQFRINQSDSVKEMINKKYN